MANLFCIILTLKRWNLTQKIKVISGLRAWYKKGDTMQKTVVILTIAIMTVSFIAFSGCVESTEQLPEDNGTHEDGPVEQLLEDNSTHYSIQASFVGNVTVENESAQTLQTVDYAKTSSSSSGFSAKTHNTVNTITTNKEPVAIISSISPSPAINGSSVTFTGSGSDTDGTIVAYLWTSDGKQISTEASFNTSSIAIGTHTVKFSVKDDDGVWSEEATETLTITEHPNIAPVARIDSITPTTATFGSEITFIGSGNDTDGAIVSYLWTSDGKQISTEPSFSTSLLAVGTHTIKFSVKDDDGAWSAEATETLTITERPNVAPFARIDSITPSTATESSSVTFKGSGIDTDGSIVAYLWTSDGKQISTEPSFSTSLLAVGTHTIKFSVKDDDGAWSAETTSTLKIEPSAEVPSRATVILTFDDGFKSDYDTVYPLLKERNISSTHYIIASMVGEDSTRMTWDHIKAMYDDGFDMECHSDTHPDLTTMSSDEIIQEMLNVNTAFVTHGMPAPKHIAYPYGECNDNVISVISSYRDTGRVVTWQNNGYYPTELLEKPYELPCYPTDYHGTIAEIDKAIAGNYTLILNFHAVSDIPGDYNMSISEFESILDYIQSNDIRNQTISEYYEETLE